MDENVIQAFRSGFMFGVIAVLLFAMFLIYIVFPLIDFVTQKLEKMVIKMVMEDVRKVTKISEEDDE